MTPAVREGHAEVPGGRVWFRVVGSGPAVPLLTLHGGPGIGHDYLEPLQALASERPVVFYDQLGCGRSSCANDPSLWRIERFAQEVAAVRATLGLERVHLFGHSWGGWLALEYMSGHPEGVVSLTLASTSASVPQHAREIAKLRDALPPATRDTIVRHEAAGNFSGLDYEAALMDVYTRHLCRLKPWPLALMRSVGHLMTDATARAVYKTLQGPSEFTITGTLKDWDRSNTLGDITVPALITLGRYDEFSPACADTLHDGIAGSELHCFEHSSHTAHLEETDACRAVLRAFLRRAETGATR